MQIVTDATDSYMQIVRSYKNILNLILKYCDLIYSHIRSCQRCKTNNLNVSEVQCMEVLHAHERKISSI